MIAHFHSARRPCRSRTWIHAALAFAFVPVSLTSIAPFHIIQVAIAEDDDEAPTPERVSSKLSTVPDSKNRMISFTDSGLEPPVLHMKKEDSILFFYNGTPDSLTTLEIDYKDKHTHCASGGLEIGDDGVVRSTSPFAPGDFASVCFHDAGTYPLTVYGLKSNPKGIKTQIIVE